MYNKKTMNSTPRDKREAGDQNLIKVKKDLIPFNRNSLNHSDVRVETQYRETEEVRRLRIKAENGSSHHKVSDRQFRIRDPRTGIWVEVVAPGRMCDKLTVDWLFDAYLKSQLKVPNFDMGSVACLRTVGGHINYDYALTKPSIALEVFPESLELEPYFFESIRGVNFEAFHMLRLAAVGGFAKVAIVRKKDTGQIYAMKIIDKNQLQGREKEEYIFEEKRILTQLDHPFLVRADSAGQGAFHLPDQQLRFLRDGLLPWGRSVPLDLQEEESGRRRSQGHDDRADSRHRLSARERHHLPGPQGTILSPSLKTS